MNRNDINLSREKILNHVKNDPDLQDLVVVELIFNFVASEPKKFSSILKPFLALVSEKGLQQKTYKAQLGLFLLENSWGENYQWTDEHVSKVLRACNVNYVDPETGHTFSMEMIKTKHLSEKQYMMIYTQSNPIIGDRSGNNLSMYIARHNHQYNKMSTNSMFELFLKSDLNHCNRTGSNLAMYIMNSNHSSQIHLSTKQILNIFEQTNLEHDNPYGNTVHTMLIENYRDEKFNFSSEQLFAFLNKANLNHKNQKGDTLAHYLVRNKDYLPLTSEQFWKLLDRSDLSQKNHSGDSPLMLLLNNPSKNPEILTYDKPKLMNLVRKSDLNDNNEVSMTLFDFFINKAPQYGFNAAEISEQFIRFHKTKIPEDISSFYFLKIAENQEYPFTYPEYMRLFEGFGLDKETLNTFAQRFYIHHMDTMDINELENKFDILNNQRLKNEASTFKIGKEQYQALIEKLTLEKEMEQSHLLPKKMKIL